MRPKKYGGMACLRNSQNRRHLFFNSRKGLSLDEVLEYENCRCIGKWWEVYRVTIAENTFSLNRELVTATPIYQIAWDLVKDPEWERRAK